MVLCFAQTIRNGTAAYAPRSRLRFFLVRSLLPLVAMEQRRTRRAHGCFLSSYEHQTKLVADTGHFAGIFMGKSLISCTFQLLWPE
jgi:hypothetical protein